MHMTTIVERRIQKREEKEAMRLKKIELKQLEVESKKKEKIVKQVLLYKKMICPNCKKIHFYKSYLRKPKHCSRECQKKTPEYFRERDINRQRKYYSTLKGKDIIKKLVIKSNEKFKEKQRARLSLNSAVQRGMIKKPKECSHCGQSILRITGHHEDYSKPLEVIWLCDYCHKQEHKKVIHR